MPVLSSKHYGGRHLLQMVLNLLIVTDYQRVGGELFVRLCLKIVAAVICARRTGFDAKYRPRGFLDLEVARKADSVF